ncbi:glycerophosphodiester phosphodiesterase [Rhodobacteraceae bacterium RKSG542]|uniref:glycerophosphodiester phosphodiesterase family protein n=1 Tax=Pseudovibrio flavus TaxID=2529854 RepID=UPI0012BC66C6|nr:glycerophosphodiester phosphodiesterase family protein [Pseudovibrio flavus]MTI16391.1 glycerophosphodiester phosphodiesterase [Pseudovibrio flavus]
MNDLSWLFARPIAHRGYHSKEDGIIENTPSAVQAAVDKNFGIEVDLQQTLDDEALVFHDDTLERLTENEGTVSQLSLSELRGCKMRGTNDPIWRLEELLELVDGKVPLTIELKSLYKEEGQNGFLDHIGKALSQYKGSAAIKSFDPRMLKYMRARYPEIVRGAVSMTHPGPSEAEHFNWIELRLISRMLHMVGTEPHFISYFVNDLPVPLLPMMHKWRTLPVMTWTVRTAEQRQKAATYANQMVFEGFDPDNI